MENRDRSPERIVPPRGRWNIQFEDQWNSGHLWHGRSINNYRCSIDRRFVEIKVSNWRKYQTTFLVDAEDFEEKVRGITWALGVLKQKYANPYWSIQHQQNKRNDPRLTNFPQLVRLARYLLNYRGHLKADHINKDTVDNRKSINLRIVTVKGNSNNRSLSRNNTTGENAISIKKARWQVQHRLPNGTYTTKGVSCGPQDIVPESLHIWIQQKREEGYEGALTPCKVSAQFRVNWREDGERCCLDFDFSDQGFEEAKRFRDEKFEEIENFNNGRDPPLGNEMQ